MDCVFDDGVDGTAKESGILSSGSACDAKRGGAVGPSIGRVSAREYDRDSEEAGDPDAEPDEESGSALAD